MPPHPGPLAAIERLGADTGRTLFYSLIVSLPVALVSGPLVGRLVSRRYRNGPGAMADQFTGSDRGDRAAVTGDHAPHDPHAGAADAAGGAGAGDDGGRDGAAVDRVRRESADGDAAGDAAGDVHVRPARAGSTAARLLQFAEESLPPIASVLLVVGAGGGFGRVLVTAGVDKAIAQVVGGFDLSPLVLGWVIAALLRLAVGLRDRERRDLREHHGADDAATMPHVNRELLVVSIGAGSLIASHVNDGGFWLVKEYFNMTVRRRSRRGPCSRRSFPSTGLAGVLLLGQLVG